MVYFDREITPIIKGSIFNTYKSADTNFFSTDLIPTFSSSTFRIYIVVDMPGVLKVKRKKGATTVTEILNGGSQLSSFAAYMFDIIVESGESINLQYSNDTTILVCKVVEIGASI
jgi:hypothetical protein